MAKSYRDGTVAIIILRNEYDNWQRIIARYVAGGEGENQLKGIYCVEKIMLWRKYQCRRKKNSR